MTSGSCAPWAPMLSRLSTAHVVENMKRKGQPVSGEELLPQGRAWLLVEFGGDDQKEANDKAEKAFARLKKIGTHASGMRLIEPAEEQDKVWHIRENGVGASHIPGVEDSWPSWEDAAVPPERLGDYLRDFNKLNERFGYTATTLRPFRRRLRARAHDLRAEDRRRRRPLPRIHAGTRPISASNMAARCPASMATARLKASYCQRCSAPS